MRRSGWFAGITDANAIAIVPASARAVALALTLAAALAAQRGDSASSASSPFTAPRLAAQDPFEVAWAAHRLDLASATGQSTAIAAALTRFAGRNDKPAQVAVLHLLRAAEQWGIGIPPERLRFDPPEFARIAWIAARVRSASDEGNELLQLFQSLDPADPAWEFVGGALALRGQRTFAVELRLALRPKLRLTVPGTRAGRPAVRDVLPRDPPEVPALAGMPPRPGCRWQRVGNSGGIGIVDGAGNALPPLDGDQIEQAQLRWLACLAQEPTPAAWPLRFRRSIRLSEGPKLRQLAAATESRARASLAAVDAVLRERFALPARLTFPPLEVLVDDRRTAEQQAAAPLPALR